jgi:hypothetical protein
MTPKEWCVARGIDPRLYFAWTAMRQRCTNPNLRQWKDWGGRGITICARWDRFAAFAADMGPHPGKGWSLDRVDTNSDYRPGNTRWATPAIQSQNRRYGAKRHLSKTQVAAIRAKDRPGTSGWYPGNRRALARAYGVSFETIRDIVNRRTWL